MGDVRRCFPPRSTTVTCSVGIECCNSSRRFRTSSMLVCKFLVRSEKADCLGVYVCAIANNLWMRIDRDPLWGGAYGNIAKYKMGLAPERQYIVWSKSCSRSNQSTVESTPVNRMSTSLNVWLVEFFKTRLIYPRYCNCPTGRCSVRFPRVHVSYHC